MDLHTIRDKMRCPDADFRTDAFWSWNGDLQELELNQQLQDFAKAGLGGFIMHAREGLETPYLSSRWLELVKESAQQGRHYGLKPFIYDDEKWPSGMAGGKVTAEYPELRACALVLSKNPNSTYRYFAQTQNNQILSLQEDPSHGGDALFLDVQYSQESDWYNGNAPANNLDARSVARFIALTHDQYKRKFENKTADFVDGFFTDEPNYCDFYAQFEPHRPWLPWTESFPELFQQKRGYSILPFLPYLFYQGTHAAKARHDYWRTLTELFSETYFKQIYEWCEQNNIKSMGHLLFENNLCSQARVCGAAMPHYRYLHVPGIDILGERIEEYLTAKQCTSVANQWGRPAISETYGCTGWQLSFEGQKWLWDWQAVMGISIRCPHLAQYTIKGLRKRDYPPVLNYQAPWWKYEPIMEAYCARLSICAQSGQVQRRILVLHPQSSVWMRCGSDPAEDLAHFDANMGWTDAHIFSLNAEYDRVNRLAQALLKNQLDFDFGDELLMEDKGSVQDKQLVINQAAYDVVVVPDADTLFSSTISLLEEFSAAGGMIIWLKKMPGCVDGAENAYSQKKFSQDTIVPDEAALIRALDAYRLVRITDINTAAAAPILTSYRKVEDGCILLAVNNNRQNAFRCRIEFPEAGTLEEYDPLRDTTTPLATDSAMGIYVDFAPADAKIFFLHTRRTPVIQDLKPVYHDVHESPKALACLGPTAAFTRTEPNTLTLDRCRWRTDGNWSAEMAVWQAQQQIREKAGFRQIYANGIPMRYLWCSSDDAAYHAQMEFRFTVLDLPITPLFLALEEWENCALLCNGTPCKTRDGWFKDRSISLVRLETVQKGENILLLDLDIRQSTEFEDIYLCGDFALDASFRMINEPRQLRFGDWCLQGYPHYAGSMIYHFQFESSQETGRLHLGQAEATTIIAHINGGQPVYLPWRAANDVEISLKKGLNMLDLEVVGSNRNLFGPLHQPYQLCSRIDWRDFRTENDRNSEAPLLVPYGLLSQCYILAQKHSSGPTAASVEA